MSQRNRWWNKFMTTWSKLIMTGQQKTNSDIFDGNKSRLGNIIILKPFRKSLLDSKFLWFWLLKVLNSTIFSGFDELGLMVTFYDDHSCIAMDGYSWYLEKKRTGFHLACLFHDFFTIFFEKDKSSSAKTIRSLYWHRKNKGLDVSSGRIFIHSHTCVSRFR